MADKDNQKKQVPLRLSKTLYEELAAWAEDDFRSLNGQIEYLLTECVRKRKKKSRLEDERDGEDSEYVDFVSVDDEALIEEVFEEFLKREEEAFSEE